MIRLFAAAALLALSTNAHAETRTYDVKGMTCGSCVNSVKKQVCGIKGIETCNVEVGKVTLNGNGLNDDDIKKAVGKAGFEVVGVEHADAAMGADVKPAPGPTLNATKPADKPAAKAKGANHK